MDRIDDPRHDSLDGHCAEGCPCVADEDDDNHGQHIDEFDDERYLTCGPRRQERIERRREKFDRGYLG